MHPDVALLEQQLLESLAQREVRFQQALTIAEQIPQSYGNGQDCEEALAQLNGLLIEVAQLEASSASVQQQWSESGGRPGTQLTATIKRVQTLLETLMAEVAKAEQLAEAARSRLVPQIQTEVKARQMRRAYEAAAQP